MAILAGVVPMAILVGACQFAAPFGVAPMAVLLGACPIAAPMGVAPMATAIGCIRWSLVAA